MSSVVLSAAVRQNLLSLQTTAAQLAATQNDLSTGKKVNTALDNPTNFFTAQGLDNRASDISNLLDGISNGVQVLQAANTGLTSIESLVNQAKSIANQALQAPLGYSSKASLTSAAITDANGNPVTAANLLGSGTSSSASLTGTSLTTTNPPITSSTTLENLNLGGLSGITVGGYSINFDSLGGGTTGHNLNVTTATVGDLLTDIATNATGVTGASVSAAGKITISGSNFSISENDPGTQALDGLGLTAQTNAGTQTGTAVNLGGTRTPFGTDTLAELGAVAGQGINVAGTTYTLVSGATSGHNISINATLQQFANVIENPGYFNAGPSYLENITAGAVTVSDAGTPGLLSALGYSSPLNLASIGSVDGNGQPTYLADAGNVTVTITQQVTGSSAAALLGIGTSDTLTVNGHAIAFANSGGTSVTASGGTIDLSSATVADVVNAIDTVSGGTSSINGSTGAITLNATASLSLTGSALSKLGLTSTTGNAAAVSITPSFKTLQFGAVGNGTATTVTFGTGAGQVSTLDGLNSKLATDNLEATLDSQGRLTITSTNDAASATIPTPTGTAISGASGAFYGATISAPVADAASQTTRATLVAQYNAILTQIDNTAADSSYNGVNLLNGDQLQLTFDETGKSGLSISGGRDSSAGLGLSALLAGTDFIDNSHTNAVLAQLDNVSSRLRSQASAFGSNLSVVQTRQDFNANLINVLQTGSANLTQADINLEAANSQALTTRQSLSVSALSLANQAQQSVLQLLR